MLHLFLAISLSTVHMLGCKNSTLAIICPLLLINGIDVTVLWAGLVKRSKEISCLRNLIAARDFYDARRTFYASSYENLVEKKCETRLQVYFCSHIWAESASPETDQHFSDQCLHSASSHQLSVPRYRLSMYGRRAFSVAGLIVWNSLPEDLRDPECCDNSFRQSLKTFLFSQY